MKNIFFPLVLLGYTAGASTVSLLEFDGSFEKTPIGVTSKFTHWSFYSPVKHIKTAIVADAPAELPVRKALFVDYTNAVASDNSRSFYSDYLPVDPQKNYRQSVWLKTDGKSERGYGVNLGRHFYDKNKKLIAYSGHHAKSLMFQNQGPETWTKYSSMLVPAKNPAKIEAGEIPPDAAFVRIYFNSYGYNRTYSVTGHEFKVAFPEKEYSCAADGAVAYPTAELQAPKIDGVIDDNCWKSDKAPWYGNFRRTICKMELSSELPAGQTYFKVWKDKENAVVALKCISSAPEKIVSAKRPPNDGKIFADETVELHIDITGSRKYIWQLTVNPDGSWAQYLNKVPQKFPLQIATARTAEGWNAEISIPLRHLWRAVNDAGGTPSELFWNFNCARTQPAADKKEQFSAWNPTGFYFYNPEAMGILLFATLEKAVEETATRAAAYSKSIDWKKLQQQMDNQALTDELKNLQRSAQIPEILLNEAKQSRNGITLASFAANFAVLRNFENLMNKQITRYQAHNIRFPEAKSAYGCFLTAANLCETVTSSVAIDAKEAKEKFQTTMAGNERAALRLRIFAGSDLKSVRLSCTELTNSNGSKLPVDLRIITPWGSDHQADILATDLRIPLKGFLENYANAERFIPEVKTGETRDILLLINSPKGTKAGKYSGTLTVAPENKTPTKVDICTEILPFDLPEAEKNVGFYSHSVIFDPAAPAIGTGGAKFYNGMESEKSFAASMKMLHDFGFNFVIQVAYRNGPLDPEYCTTLLKLMKDSGIKRTALMGAEHLISPASIEKGNEKMLDERKKRLNERIGKIKNKAQELGFEEFYIYGFDEPNDDKGVMRNNIIFEICRKQSIPGIVSCIFEDIRRKIKNMDTVVMSYQSMTSQNHNLLHRTENGLKRMYYCNLTGGFDTAVRLNFGWYLEKSKFDGAAPWALYYLAHYWDPFRDFHASNEDYANNGCYIFITKDTPIPTMKFIAASAGVTDMRYIQKFKEELKKCRNKELQAKLQKEFEVMLENFELRNKEHNQSRNFKLPAKLYDDLRTRLQKMITECR